jgi:hypothetical protein
MSFVPPGSSFVFRCVYDVVFLTVFRSSQGRILCDKYLHYAPILFWTSNRLLFDHIPEQNSASICLLIQNTIDSIPISLISLLSQNYVIFIKRVLFRYVMEVPWYICLPAFTPQAPLQISSFVGPNTLLNTCTSFSLSRKEIEFQHNVKQLVKRFS